MSLACSCWSETKREQVTIKTGESMTKPSNQPKITRVRAAVVVCKADPKELHNFEDGYELSNSNETAFCSDSHFKLFLFRFEIYLCIFVVGFASPAVRLFYFLSFLECV